MNGSVHRLPVKARLSPWPRSTFPIDDTYFAAIDAVDAAMKARLRPVRRSPTRWSLTCPVCREPSAWVRVIDGRIGVGCRWGCPAVRIRERLEGAA